MNVASALRVLLAAVRRVAAWGAVLGVSPTVTQAQTTASSRIAPGAVERSGFMQAFDRLDPMGAALIVGAAVILLLLFVRIWMMVRGERPAAVPPPARRRPRTVSDDEPLDRPTLQRATDWGHDQNSRAAQAREPVTVSSGSGDLPSLDDAVTQWSTSEVHNAASISRQANDSMGKPSNLPPSPYRTAFNPYYRGEAIGAPMEVVEVADTLLQAELLVQLGDPKQAMTLLSNHIRETEEPGPAVWLMLLNLYQSTGRKSQYEALSTGFTTLFNAAVPPWPATKEIAARDIESYPQVMMKLHTTWGKPALRATLEALLNDDRGGSRQGFSLNAYRDLLFLIEIVTELESMARDAEDRAGIQRKLQGAG